MIDPGPNMLPRFLAMALEFPSGSRVLHTGTARSDPRISTMARQVGWFGDRDFCHWGTDLAAGPDVDLVCDLHEISCLFPPRTIRPRVDIVVSCSTFEHLAEPWVVAAELAEVTRPGGLIFVQTHQTFVIHGYPDDYFRFTTQALRSLFSAPRSWETIAAGYEFPCKITPPPEVAEWNDGAPAYLNVCAIARRI